MTIPDRDNLRDKGIIFGLWFHPSKWIRDVEEAQCLLAEMIPIIKGQNSKRKLGNGEPDSRASHPNDLLHYSS